MGEVSIVIEKLREAKARQRALLWLKFKSNKAAFISLCILTFIFLLAILGPYMVPESPYDFNLSRALEPPSLNSIFGRDELGRNILSRVIVGSRFSIGVALLSVLLGGCIGVLLGLVSGYIGGKVDVVIQRFTDILLAFPTILLAIALISVLGVGIGNLIVSIGVSTVPIYIRLSRSLVFQIRSEDYITAAFALGKSGRYIMFRHVLPNILPAIIVQSTYYMGLSLLLASGLGFLGLGVQPPIPEWGAMIGSGRTYIYSSPHVIIFPGLFILISALCFNLTGDGLRDALDPRIKVMIRRAG
ncbi:MAG: ABC transporter permease [Candidatus Methanomethylicia archaeon]